jgi:DNA-directed RNA polymerase specialized sigma24 family protein
MLADDMVTHWIGQLKAGNRDAVRQLFELYWRRLVETARRRLLGRPPVPADAEDVALSAFHSFCARAAQDRFRRLDDRNDLWKLLGTITRRKANNLVARETAQKRGGGAVRCVTDLPAGEEEGGVLARARGAEPAPDVALQLAEECEQRLAGLPEVLRVIARLRLEGYGTGEIAARLECAPHTVTRKLRLIRGLWSRR